MNIAELLEVWARSSPRRIALVERQRRMSFGALNDAAKAGAAMLRERGIGPGDRVQLVCPMSIRLYVALLALFRVGATAVVVEPGPGRTILDRCTARVRPTAFMGVPAAHLLRLLSPAVRRRMHPAIVLTDAWPGANVSLRGCPIHPCAPASAALITLTSGTTGEPKAAVRTHGFLIAQHEVLASALALEAGDVDLSMLPMFVLANLASGVTSVIADANLRAPATIDPGPVCRQIGQERPHRMAASPAFMDRVARYACERRIRFDTLRNVYIGGGPVTSRVLDATQLAMPGARVTAVYGSTEAEPIAHVSLDEITPSDRERMDNGGGLLAGQPIAATELAIVPDQWGHPIGPFNEESFARTAQPAGTAGEIVVAGPHVLAGYLDGAGDLETKFTVGGRVWHRTGDAGYLDQNGRLWLLGRAGARVADEHGTIYPLSVEAAALSDRWVRRAAFVHVDGQRTLAVELHREAPPDARKALRLRLSWARVERVVALDSLPVDSRHNAKVDYRRVRAQLAAG